MFGPRTVVTNADPDCLVARFTFSELCERNIGAMDFRTIAEQFSILFIEEVPILSLKNPSQHDQARRFITLIDEAYEARCALFAPRIRLLRVQRICLWLTASTTAF
jgi:protein AFG1